MPALVKLNGDEVGTLLSRWAFEHNRDRGFIPWVEAKIPGAKFSWNAGTVATFYFDTEEEATIFKLKGLEFFL